MAEVHFIGSLVGAESFTLGAGQGMSVQYQVIADNGSSGGFSNGGVGGMAGSSPATALIGKASSGGNMATGGGNPGTTTNNIIGTNTTSTASGWQLLEGVPFGTTHTDLTGTGYPVFSHPLDLHYTTTKIVGWPKIVVQVLQVSALGKYEVVSLVAYGCVSLPMMPGRHSVKIPTWKPVGTVKEELMSWLFGTQISPRQWQLISDPSNRYKITARSMGNIILDLTVLGRHFENYGITWG